MTVAGATQYVGPMVANLFPAKVLNPAGGTMHDRSRVVITPDLMVVYSERTSPSGMRQVHTAFKMDVTEVRPSMTRGGDWIVTDAEGNEWSVERGAWCGCGSPLKVMPSPLPVDMG